MRKMLAIIGIAVISAPAAAQTVENTCEGFVSEGPRQGVHTRFNQSADAVAWPPNHKLRGVTISALNADGDECDVTITDARQDEMLNGEGDGNTSPDAANCNNSGNASTIDVRGERSGMGTGRYYHIMYTMDDPDSVMAKMDEALILVPHDQGVAHTGTWVDEGALFASYEGAALECDE